MLCENNVEMCCAVDFLGSNPSQKPQENLEIWDVKTGQLVHAFVQRKQNEWWVRCISLLYTSVSQSEQIVACSRKQI